MPSVTQPPQVRKLADFNEISNTATLWDKTLAEIIEQGLESLPVIVISIGGVARSGKSFLLNVLVSYLSYIEQVSKHFGKNDSYVGNTLYFLSHLFSLQ